MLATVPSSRTLTGAIGITMPFRATLVPSTLILAPMLLTQSPCSISSMMGHVLAGFLGFSGSSSTAGAAIYTYGAGSGSAGGE